MHKTILATTFILAMAGVAIPALAGNVFLTGHDPDFHAQDDAGAQNLLRIGLQFAANGAINSGNKLLWVESDIAVPSGHRLGVDGLTGIGLIIGTDFDVVTGSQFLVANLSNYSAIGVASSFGGDMTDVELDALVARKLDIKSFINSGKGLFASAECTEASSPGNCTADLLGPSANLPFSYLPVTVTSIAVNQIFTVTPFGTGLGLTVGDVSSPTHNAFGAIGGLTIVDTDGNGNAVTLAGKVFIDDGGFHPVPEPATTFLLGLGLVAIGASRRKSKSD